jgi:hypothetical protein
VGSVSLSIFPVFFFATFGLAMLPTPSPTGGSHNPPSPSSWRGKKKSTLPLRPVGVKIFTRTPCLSAEGGRDGGTPASLAARSSEPLPCPPSPRIGWRCGIANTPFSQALRGGEEDGGGGVKGFIPYFVDSFFLCRKVPPPPPSASTHPKKKRQRGEREGGCRHPLLRSASDALRSRECGEANVCRRAPPPTAATTKAVSSRSACDANGSEASHVHTSSR